MAGTDGSDPVWARLAIVTLLVASTLQGLPAASASEPAQPPWRVATNVNATVVDNYATVNVSVTIHNPAAGDDFPFEVPLPEDAYVTGLAITRNGTTYEGEVQPIDQAREDYRKARSEGRSAGLVEQGSDDSAYSYRVNVAPNQTVRATLTYETYLVAHEGTYTLPLTAPATPRGQDEGARFSVDVRHGRGLADVWSEPDVGVETTDENASFAYEVGARQPGNATSFDVHYRTQPTEPGGRLIATVHNGTGYFAHRFQASANASRMPIDLALVLDRSGSMSGAKIDQLAAATRQVVDHLGERDRVHLTTFSHEARSPWPGFRAVDADLADRLDQRLAEMQAGGGTNIEDGIRDGFSTFEARGDADRRLPVVAFLTDGKATAGIQSDDRLRTLALEVNEVDAHVFGLAFGAGADWGLVHGLADDADGYAERVPASPEAQLDLERFLTRLTSPVLKNVSVTYEQPSVETWRHGAPVLFSGGELVYVGTFDPNVTRLEATVHAEGATRTVAEDVWAAVEETGGEHLPRLVAYQRVQALEDRIDAHGSNETLEQRALELALEHGFVTERTSLVVDLPRERDAEEDIDDATNATDTATSVPDTDGDGLPDGHDRCPSNVGTAGNQGCPQQDAAHDPADDGQVTERDQGTSAQPQETPGTGPIGAFLAMIAIALHRRRRSG